MIRKDILPQIERVSYKIDGFKGINAEKDENAFSLDFGCYGYNIDFNNGVLKQADGVDYAKHADGKLYPILPTLGKGIDHAYLFKRYDYENEKREDRFLTIDKSRRLSYAKTDDLSFTFLNNIAYRAFDKVIFLSYFYNNKDVALIYSSIGDMHIYDGDKIEKYFDVPCFNSACVHFGRVFGSDSNEKTKLHFSVPLDPTDFGKKNGGGFLQIVDGCGNINKVLSFNEYIYIFKDFGVYRLTAYTDPLDYKVVKLFESSSYIIPNTITVCDDKIVYATEEGMFAFDGFKAVQIFKNITNLVESYQYAQGIYFKNKFTICLRMKDLDNAVVGDETDNLEKNNAVFTLDMKNGSISIIRGIDITGFLQYNIDENTNDLLCWFGTHRLLSLGVFDDSGRIFGTKVRKLWRSPITDLKESTKLISVKKTHINSKYNCEISIKQEKTHTRAVIGGKANSHSYLSQGSNFQIEISTLEDELNVTALQIDINMVRRLYGQ